MWARTSSVHGAPINSPISPVYVFTSKEAAVSPTLTARKLTPIAAKWTVVTFLRLSKLRGMGRTILISLPRLLGMAIAIAALCMCGKGFSRLQSLNQHLASPAHQQNLYHCPRCQRQFVALSGLVNHLESESCGAFRYKAGSQGLAFVDQLRLGD